MTKRQSSFGPYAASPHRRRRLPRSLRLSNFAWKWQSLFRKPPYAEGNRQPDHDHVHQQSLNQVTKCVRAPRMKCGERQNDKIHYLLNRTAKEQAAHYWVLLQKNQLAACRIVHSRRRARDKEVQENAKNKGTGASIEG